MALIESRLVVSRQSSRWWELEEDLHYAGNDEVFTIPRGFRTDFATVPRILTWLVPKYGKYTVSAVLHDYLCTFGVKHGWLSSRDADGLFRRSMRELGVGFTQRWIMWAGVRVGAMFSRTRRPGVWKDIPLVLAISVLVLPVILPAIVAILAALGIYSVLTLALRSVGIR